MGLAMEIIVTYIEGVIGLLCAKKLILKNENTNVNLGIGIGGIAFTIVISVCNFFALVSIYTYIISAVMLTIIEYIILKKKIGYLFVLNITYLTICSIMEMMLICLLSVITKNTDYVFGVLSNSSMVRMTFIGILTGIKILMYLVTRNRLEKADYGILKNPAYVVTTLILLIMTINMVNIISSNSMGRLKIEIVILFITIIIILVIVFYLCNDLMKNKIMVEEQRHISKENEILEKSIKNLNELYKENSKNFHDFNHHLGALSIMLENGQYDNMKKYISEINMVSRHKQRFFTGNNIVDIVLNVKYEKILEMGIKFDCQAEISNAININDTDMCSVLSNIIDNAIEANENVKINKFIKLRISSKGNFIVISLENSCNENPLKNGFASKKKGNHGWGMKIVEDISNKYNGKISTEYKNGAFLIKILLVQITA